MNDFSHSLCYLFTELLLQNKHREKNIPMSVPALAKMGGGVRTRPLRRGGDYDRLNVRQKMFCDLLLADPEFNATKAAKAAGFKTPAHMAKKLLANKTINKIIGKHIHERLVVIQMSADDVLQKLWQVLNLDPLVLFEKKGKNYEVKDLELVPLEIRQCIKGIKARTRHLKDGSKETAIEIEFMSKDSALNHALKHFGLVAPDGQVNVNVGPTFQDLLVATEENRGKVIDAKFIANKVSEGN